MAQAEKATEVKVATAARDIHYLVEGEELAIPDMFVTREKIEPKKKTDRVMYAYAVKVRMRGHDMRIELIPDGNGNGNVDGQGYDLLDIIMNGRDSMPLIATPYSITNDDKSVTKGISIIVKDADEDGTVYSCKVRAKRASDKSILQTMLAKAGLAVK